MVPMFGSDVFCWAVGVGAAEKDEKNVAETNDAGSQRGTRRVPAPRVSAKLRY